MREVLPNSREIWEKKFENWGDGKRPEFRLLEFFKKYGKEIGPKILDDGSGDGRHLVPLAEAGHGITGLELTTKGIKKTKEKLAKQNARAELVQGNFHNLPFEKDSFNTIISTQAMQHNIWEGAEKAFAEAARVLKRGGLFFLRVNSDKSVKQDDMVEVKDKGRTWYRITEGHGGYHHSFSMEELKELAEKYGLEIVEYVDEKKTGPDFIILGQWNAVFRKKKEQAN